MKRQYIRLFSLMIGLTFVISGVLFSLVNNYKKNKEEIIKQENILADEIGNVYETFYNKEKELNDFRDLFLDDIKEFSEYFSNMPGEYKNIVTKLGKYETLIKEVEDASSFLQQKCKKRYSSSTANEKCDAYYINLEKTINIFVGDLEFFNAKINDYNEWIVTENESVLVKEKYKALEKYEATNYKDYVDLNKDDTYLAIRRD